MKYIAFIDLPINVKETITYKMCNTYGGTCMDSKNHDDEVFENVFRCTLVIFDDCWFLEFTDEEYTWFILRWSY